MSVWLFTFAFLVLHTQTHTKQQNVQTPTRSSRTTCSQPHDKLMLTFVPHQDSYAHNKSLHPTPQHTEMQTQNTQAFCSSLSSQLCSAIKQCNIVLRENKHADEERLAGHRGLQYTHTVHPRVLLEGKMNARELYYVLTGAYYARLEVGL